MKDKTPSPAFFFNRMRGAEHKLPNFFFSRFALTVVRKLKHNRQLSKHYPPYTLSTNEDKPNTGILEGSERKMKTLFDVTGE